jgi:hypothetical protein
VRPARIPQEIYETQGSGTRADKWHGATYHDLLVYCAISDLSNFEAEGEGLFYNDDVILSIVLFTFLRQGQVLQRKLLPFTYRGIPVRRFLPSVCR